MECYLLQGLKGVENVFTQHTCWLKEILEDVFKGRTIDPLYPCFGSEPFRSVCAQICQDNILGILESFQKFVNVLEALQSS